jgi:HAD superfamily phosphoserine phosphatase-like hydrolase
MIMRERNGSNRKIVVFDMDNTIMQDRFIEVCAERFKFQQALTLLRQIDTDHASLTRRIAFFLRDRTKTEILEIAASIPLVEDIQSVVSDLKKRSYIVGIISDSYQLVTRMVAQRVGADFELSNELQFLGDRLTGEVLIPSYFHYSPDSTCRHQVCKTNALRYICKAHHTNFEDCIVVGDSDNDACMIRHAGLGVAFCATSDLVRSVAQKSIEERSFRELLTMAP